jgi:Domain of unknown function (DUF4157)
MRLRTRTKREPVGGHSEGLQVQRQGSLQPPSLLQPPDPASKYRLGGDPQLKLSPEFLAMAARYIDEQIDPTKLRPVLGKVNYFGPGLPKLPTPAEAAAASGEKGGAAPHPGVDPKSVPPVPQRGPLVPAGKGPSKPKTAEFSDLAEAVASVPVIEQALTTLKTEAKGKVSSDWAKLKTGEKAAVVTTLVTIGAGSLGGAASDPEARQFMLSQLNSKILPVPAVPWLNLEVNTEKGNMMVGMHVDVGRLLPSSWGFGPGSPEAIGAPPIPGQRTATGTMPNPVRDNAADGEVADRVRRMAGTGSPLPASLRDRFEGGLGTDLSRVRVHTGMEADRLARVVDAVAFTTGSDIFFRFGAYAPGTAAGLRLLAHEATHTVQQTAGPVSGVPTVGGVAISEPDDRFERAADRSADRLVRAAPAGMPRRMPATQGPHSDKPRPWGVSAGHRWEDMAAFPRGAPALAKEAPVTGCGDDGVTPAR